MMVHPKDRFTRRLLKEKNSEKKEKRKRPRTWKATKEQLKQKESEDELREFALH